MSTTPLSPRRTERAIDKSDDAAAAAVLQVAPPPSKTRHQNKQKAGSDTGTYSSPLTASVRPLTPASQVTDFARLTRGDTPHVLRPRGPLFPWQRKLSQQKQRRG